MRNTLLLGGNAIPRPPQNQAEPDSYVVRDSSNWKVVHVIFYKAFEYPRDLDNFDEWAVAERRYFSAESMKQLTAPTLPATAQEIFAAIA